MNVPKERALSKLIEIEGEHWQINKLSAYDGAYIGYTILNNALPPFVAQAVGGEVGKAAAAGPQMGKEQFTALMRDLLKACEKKLPAGFVAAVDANGEYQVPGLEYDLQLSLRLLVEVIRFNFSDFFVDGGLLESVAALFGMSR